VIDLMATCVDLAGASCPAEYEGRTILPPEGISLRPAFEGKSLRRPQPLFWEHEGNRAIRDGKWKLVARHRGPWELYDMDADRIERHDRAAAMPAKVEELATRWKTWADRVGVRPWPIERPEAAGGSR
jgi:arylsulfatase